MEKQEAIKLFINLVDKLYNLDNLTDDILDEIDNDLKQIDSLLPQKQYYRELVLFLNQARETNDINLRNNYKYLFLSDLEKRLEMLKNL